MRSWDGNRVAATRGGGGARPASGADLRYTNGFALVWAEKVDAPPASPAPGAAPVPGAAPALPPPLPDNRVTGRASVAPSFSAPTSAPIFISATPLLESA